jgi:hypothetical protein
MGLGGIADETESDEIRQMPDALQLPSATVSTIADGGRCNRRIKDERQACRYDQQYDNCPEVHSFDCFTDGETSLTDRDDCRTNTSHGTTAAADAHRGADFTAPCGAGRVACDSHSSIDGSTAANDGHSWRSLGASTGFGTLTSGAGKCTAAKNSRDGCVPDGTE